MKKLRLSIANTTYALKDRIFNYQEFRKYIVAGLIADGYEYVEMDSQSDCLSCLDRGNRKWLSISLFAEFNKLKSI